MKTSSTTAIVLSLLLAACSGGPSPDNAAEESGKRPRLQLRSSAASGFIPLTFLLSARLENVDLTDESFADPGEKWVERHLDLDSITERAPSEGRLAQKGLAKTHFERTVTLTEPGTYRFRLTITSAEGREVSSGWVSVRAIARQ